MKARQQPASTMSQTVRPALSIVSQPRSVVQTYGAKIPLSIQPRTPLAPHSKTAVPSLSQTPQKYVFISGSQARPPTPSGPAMMKVISGGATSTIQPKIVVVTLPQSTSGSSVVVTSSVHLGAQSVITSAAHMDDSTVGVMDDDSDEEVKKEIFIP